MELEFSVARSLFLLMIIGLAMFGAHARFVFDHGKLEWRPLLAEYVIGIFTGLCVFYLVSETDKIGKELKYFFVIMSGFCARDIVKLISFTFMDKFQKFIGTPASQNQVEEKKEDPKAEDKPADK